MMKKMDSSKIGEIKSKMQYAHTRMQALSTAIFEARKMDQNPTHLEHETADVVAAVRECLDYFAIDIFEAYVAPTALIDKSEAYVARLRKRVYFPFAQATLEDTNTPLQMLSTTYPELYAYLHEFLGKCATEEHMPLTMLPYKTFPDMRHMVDTKKHREIVAIKGNSSGEVIWEDGQQRRTYNLRAQVGWDPTDGNTIPNGKLATEYRFLFNDIEVEWFCYTCIWATRRLINEIYKDFFKQEYSYSRGPRPNIKFHPTANKQQEILVPVW